MKVSFELMRKAAGIIGSMMIMLSLTSCLDDEGSTLTPVAFVSIFHASPDAPDLDVVLDNRVILDQPLEYADYTPYLQFFTGSRKLAFNPFDASNVLFDTTYNFQTDKVYSVFVADDLADMSALIVRDSAGAPAAGKALVRFVQLSPDAPAVDFGVGDEDTPLFASQAFKTATNFTEVTAGTHTLAVKAAGDDEVLVSATNTELKSEGIYTVIVRGFVAPPSGNTNSLNIQIVRNE